MFLARVIVCVTVLSVSACSSDPIGRIAKRSASADDDEDTASSRVPKPTKPGAQPGDGAGAGDAGAADDDASASGPSDPPAVPPPAGTSPPPPPPPATPPPAATTPVGTTCQVGDAKEILGKQTPFTSGACGELKDSGDQDDYAFDIAAPKTFTIRIGAEADAIAKITTPNGSTAVIDKNQIATVNGLSGTFSVNVRSKTGTVQDYRLLVQ